MARLILHPVEYFLEKGVGRIILVSSNDEDENENHIIGEQKRNEDIDEVNGSFSIMIDNDGIISKTKNVIHTKNNIKCKNKIWEFCFSCDKQINITIHSEIENYLKKYNYEIKDVISDEIKIKRLINVLNKCKLKFKFNESSMILVHHPIHNYNNYTIHSRLSGKYVFYDCRYKHCISSTHFGRCVACCFNCCTCNKCCFDDPLSTVLTGDVVLNGTVCSVIQQFVNHNVPGIFQVPHHGSKSNSENCINFVNSYSQVCSIIPCGYMYNHPSQYIYNLLDNPYIVDMYHSYVYMIDCF